MSKFTISDFYCTQCGNKSIPIPRKSTRTREPGHLKKLYCIYCQKKTNHAECRGFGDYTHDDFLIEFNAHNFDEEGNRKQSWRQCEAEVLNNG